MSRPTVNNPPRPAWVALAAAAALAVPAIVCGGVAWVIADRAWSVWDRKRAAR